MAMPTATPDAPPSAGIAVAVRRILALGFVAGYINALGYVQLSSVYTGAMTGNTIQFGISLAQGHWAKFALVAATLVAFFIGALISSFIRRHLPSPPLELFIMAALVFCAQIVRLVSGYPLPIELPLLASALAMQGETISRFGGTSLQTIVVTNNLIKLADAIIGRWSSRGDSVDPDRSWTDIVLPICGWTSCAAGACVGTLATLYLPLPLMPPVLILILVTLDLIGFPLRGIRQ